MPNQRYNGVRMALKQRYTSLTSTMRKGIEDMQCQSVSIDARIPQEILQEEKIRARKSNLEACVCVQGRLTFHCNAAFPRRYIPDFD